MGGATEGVAATREIIGFFIIKKMVRIFRMNSLTSLAGWDTIQVPLASIGGFELWLKRTHRTGYTGLLNLWAPFFAVTMISHSLGFKMCGFCFFGDDS